MTPDDLREAWRVAKPWVTAALGVALGVAVHWTCTR